MPTDYSQKTDDELIAMLAEAGNTSEPAAPAFDWLSVAKGLRPSELKRADADPQFKQSMVDRHALYQYRLDQGENPERSQDFELWRWRRAATAPTTEEKVERWIDAPFLAIGDFFKSGAEFVKESVKLNAKAVGIAGVDWTGPKFTTPDPVGAIKGTADLATVATGKAMQSYSALGRGASAALSWAAKEVNTIGADPEKREQFEEVHARHVFNASVANHRDREIVDDFHKNIALAVPALQGIVGTTEVNQQAAEFLSEAPEMGVEALVARGIARAGLTVRAGTELKTSAEALAKLRERQAVTQSLHDAVGGAPTDRRLELSAELEGVNAEIATREAAMNELVAKSKAEFDALTEAGKTRVAAGRSASVLGATGEKIGAMVERLQALPRNVAESIAPGSPALQDVLQTAAGAATGAAIGYTMDETAVGGLMGGAMFNKRLPAMFTGAGRDIRRAGEILAQGKSTLSFHRNFSKARDVSGFSRQLSAFIDGSGIATATRYAATAAEGAAGAAAVGAAFGAAQDLDDPIRGALAGAGPSGFIGATVGAFSQWQMHSDPAALVRERAGQLRVYKDQLKTRPGELRVFETLPEATQTSLANYLAALPDLQVEYTIEPGKAGGWHDPADPGKITINLASPDPIADVVAHEIAHYAAEHELHSEIVMQAFGDSAAGIPGDFTARDEAGQPIRNPDGSWQLSEEFTRLQNEYLSRLDATAARAGWSAEKLAGAKAHAAKPENMANEIFAEQHLAYLNSSEFTSDLKGQAAPAVSDSIMGSSFLKDTLAKLGVVFKLDGGVVESGVFGNFPKSPAFEKLMRKYHRQRAARASGDIEFAGRDLKIDESALNKKTGYLERYLDASSSIVRDAKGAPVLDAQGRASIRPEREVTADARAVADLVVEHLDREADARAAGRTKPADGSAKGSAESVRKDEASPSGPKPEAPAESVRNEGAKAVEATKVEDDPRAVQRRTLPDGTIYYDGEFFTDATLAAIEKSGKFNKVQLDQLRQLNGELKSRGPGMVWRHFYQPAQAKGKGPRARSLSGRWRKDIAYRIKVTKAQNIIVQSVSPEVLAANAAQAVSRGLAKPWNNEMGALMADAQTYLENVTAGRPGETGLDVEKKNFLQNLTGIRVGKHGEVNPLHETTNIPKIVITSLRLDRINRLMPAGERSVPFTAESYQRVAKNLRPDEDAANLRPDATVSKVSDKNDNRRVGTSRLGTKTVPVSTPQSSNIQGSRVPSELLAKQMAVVDYPHLPEDIRGEKDPAAKRDKFVTWMKDNLLALHDAFPAELRARATHWYDGAHDIATEFSTRSGYTVEQSGAVLAVLSPQKDWFMNVAQAEQVIDLWKNHQNTAISDALVREQLEDIIEGALATPGEKREAKPGESSLAATRRKNANNRLDQAAKDARRQTLEPMIGKTLQQLDSDPYLQGWAIRVMAQSLHGREFRIISPEGEAMGIVTTKGGESRKNGWGSISEIQKAVLVLKDGSLDNISEQLGSEHKVRNFYNNIVAPNTPFGDATMDTHAVAAAHLMPFGSGARPVLHNFGSGGAPSSGPLGISGLYHAYLDAYTAAAKEVGLMPRQMQSITWEAIRQIYPPESRRDPKVVAGAAEKWKLSSYEESRKQLVGNGISSPSWAGAADGGQPSGVAASVGEARGRDDAGGGLRFRGSVGAGPDGAGANLRPDAAVLKDRPPLLKENGELAYPQKRFRGPITLTHYSEKAGLDVIDPAFMGTGRARFANHNLRMMAGEKKTFWFVGKTPAGENIPKDLPGKYRISLDPSKLYDMDADPIRLWKYPNPAKSEGALKAAGYDGIFAETDDGRQFVALFHPVDTATGALVRRADAPEADVGTNTDRTADIEAAAYERELAAQAWSRTQLLAKLGRIDTIPGFPVTKVSGDPDAVKPAPALVFVSPNTSELSYAQAKERLAGEEHKQFAAKVRGMAGDNFVTSAVGDWVDGAEDSVVISYTGIPKWEETRRLAAQLGLDAKQKAVLHVVADAKGPDAIVKVTFPSGTTIDKARKAFDKADIKFRTLIPQGDSVVAYLFDEGRKMTPQLKKLESSAEVRAVAARGEFLGSWTSREEGAAKFREVLGANASPKPKSKGKRVEFEYDASGKFKGAQLVED